MELLSDSILLKSPTRRVSPYYRRVAANQSKVEAIAQGRTQLAGFFIGQVMRQMPNTSPSGEASCVPSVRIIRLSENDLPPRRLSPTPLKSPSIDSTA